MANERPVLIILPSPLIRARSYQRLAKSLRPYFKVHTPELPESGGHRSAKKVWTVEGYAEWVVNEMNRLQIRRAILMGHSNSGAIAMRVAAVYPERVQALILADSTGLRKQGYLRTLIGRILDAIIEVKFTFWSGFHLFTNFIFHRRNFLSQIKAIYDLESIGDVARIHSRTLIAWGKKDHTIPLNLAWGLKRKLINAELYISPNGSHDWVLTQPDEFVTAVMNWMKPSASQ